MFLPLSCPLLLNWVSTWEKMHVISLSFNLKLKNGLSICIATDVLIYILYILYTHHIINKGDHFWYSMSNNNNNGNLRSSLVMRSWPYKELPTIEWAFFFLVGLDFCHQFVHVFRAKRSVSRIQLHCNCRDGRIPYSTLSIINNYLVNLLSVQRSKLLYLTMFSLGNYKALSAARLPSRFALL